MRFAHPQNASFTIPDVYRKKIDVQYVPNLCHSTYPLSLVIDSRTNQSRIPFQGRAKHILQCRRRSLGGPQYQQRYRNEKRAHRRVQRDFVQFCYLCAEMYCGEQAWLGRCQSHIDNLHPRCGMLTFRYTLVAPSFCPFCLGDEDKKPDERFQQWLAKATLLNHIDKHLDALRVSTAIFCPHPCCERKDYRDVTNLRRHFFDAHSIEEPRSNCVSRKRKWQSEPELEPESRSTLAHLETSDVYATLRFGNQNDEDIPASLEEEHIAFQGSYSY